MNAALFTSEAESRLLGADTTLLRLSTQQTYLSSMVNFMGKYMEPFEIIINLLSLPKVFAHQAIGRHEWLTPQVFLSALVQLV
jgi:hypothetical protein